MLRQMEGGVLLFLLPPAASQSGKYLALQLNFLLILNGDRNLSCLPIAYTADGMQQFFRT